jgi:cysteine desulfurase family protein
MIYLDNAATTFPKPESVYEACNLALREKSGNPGRSGHSLSLEANATVQQTRLLLSKLFNVSKPEQIVFTLNATDALNLALKGLLKSGDHVITSTMEHNSVARPLNHLKIQGIEVSTLNMDIEHGVCPQDLASSIRENTSLVALTHVSNVSGTANDIAALGEVCQAASVPFLLDAAQSAGCVPIDVNAMGIDLLAFPGHKGLYGPQGTGGLYIASHVELEPLRCGGTGTDSESSVQPNTMPDKYESGTQNVPGIAGLGAGVEYVGERGVENIQTHDAELANRFIEGISATEGIKIYGPAASENRSGVVSFTFERIAPTEFSMILDGVFNIASRAGLHCAPSTHASLGTINSGGTVRISFSALNTKDDCENAISAVSEITRGS